MVRSNTVRGMLSGALICAMMWCVSTASAASRPAVCEQQVSPYSLSPEQRQECGDQTYRLAETESLGDSGGKRYVYDVPGGSVTFLVPPPSFDAAGASASELELYGIPTAPPADSPQYGPWREMIDNYHPETSPSTELIGLPTQATIQNSHWSGWVNTASSQIFKEAQGYYVEPYDHGTVCSKAAAVTWVGLGGLHSNQLAQLGTAIGESGLEAHQMWWEILPQYKTVLAMKHKAVAGNTVLAEVKEISSTSFQFFIDDIGGESHSFIGETTTNGYDGSSADYIVERPLQGSAFAKMTNFGEVPFEGFTNNNPIGKYGHESIKMVNEEESPFNLLAQPGGLSTEDKFTDYHYNCK